MWGHLVGVAVVAALAAPPSGASAGGVPVRRRGLSKGGTGGLVKLESARAHTVARHTARGGDASTCAQPYGLGMVLDLEARQREVCSVEAESGPGTAVGCSSFNRESTERMPACAVTHPSCGASVTQCIECVCCYCMSVCD
jgi:hypothetical protein